MELAILIIPFAVLTGYLRGGNLSNLAKVKIYSLWTVFTGFTLRFLVNYPVIFNTLKLDILIPYLPILNILAYLILFYFCYRNLSLPGIRLASLGAFTNFLVIAVNGGRMPFQTQQAIRASIYKILEQTANSGVPIVADNYKLPLWFLGDWIRFPGIRSPKLISIGDILIMVAVFYLIEELITGRPIKKD